MIDTFNWIMSEVFPKVLIVDVVWLIASIIIGGVSVDILGYDNIVAKACKFVLYVCLAIATVLIVFHMNVFLIELVFFYHPA